MTTTERIAAIREALKKVQVVATSTMHKMDRGFVPDPEGETLQALKNAMALINPATLEAEMSAEPVETEEQDLADRYLYIGWLAARPDRPWTDEDAREAFLHALKYARAHPPKPEASMSLQATIDAELNSEPVACDYRRFACADTGETIGGKWVCKNHIPPKPEQGVSERRALPSAEDVKRWYQLLVGMGELSMMEDMNRTFAELQPADPDAHIKDPEAYLAAKQERAKGTDFDGIEAERKPPTYAMSKDYEALYELLCNGGEAIVRYPDTNYIFDRVNILRIDDHGSLYFTGHRIGPDQGDMKSIFIAECQRLNLEWIAPTDLAGVVEAGDELTKLKGSLSNFILSLHPRERHGHFTMEELDRMTRNWTNATKHLRPNT